LLLVLSLSLDRIVLAIGADLVPALDGGGAFADECTGMAFNVRGSTAGSIVSLVTTGGGAAKVTGMFRCTSKFTVSSSCFELSQ